MVVLTIMLGSKSDFLNLPPPDLFLDFGFLLLDLWPNFFRSPDLEFFFSAASENFSPPGDELFLSFEWDSMARSLSSLFFFLGNNFFFFFLSS